MDRESGLAATSASASASACAYAGLFLDGWTAGRGLPFSPHPPHPPRPPTYYSSSTATLRCPPSTHARRDSITKHQANAVALFFLLSLRLPSSEAALYAIHSYSKPLFRRGTEEDRRKEVVYKCDAKSMALEISLESDIAIRCWCRVA
uniref:Uncharacterized protein n=1 Tax=Vespula pensylvanica TaxID=30213 RepID=A0A834PG84_VESPE|nr:hypothetical protein H0235_001017 [Vespula pensylvanica]